MIPNETLAQFLQPHNISPKPLPRQQTRTHQMIDRQKVFLNAMHFIFGPLPFYVIVQRGQKMAGGGRVANDASQTQSWHPCGKHITQGVRAHARTVWPQL